MLLTPGTEENRATVKDPDIPADPEGNCDELGGELVGPADPEELDGGNNPDVDRAEGGTLMLGMPVDGVIAEPVKVISGVLELGLGLMIEPGPAPADGVPSWLLAVTAPVFIDASVGSEDGPPPVVRVARILETELVAPTDDMLLEMPDDEGIGPVPEPVIEPENVVLVVDKDCETEPGLVIVPSLVMLTDGGEVVLVKFVGGWGPGLEPCEVGVRPVTGTLPKVTPVLDDGTDMKVTVELGIVKGGFAEREPDGTSEPLVAVVRKLPELDSVSDPDGTVPLGAESAVEFARVKGGVVERGLPELVSDGNNTVPFDTGTTVVRVVPMMVVGSAVAVVVAVMVVSTAVVIVVPVTVIGVIVNVSIEDEIPVLFALAEFAGTDRLLVEVEFVTGYGDELDGCTDMAPELPLALALVRLAPEEDSEIGEVPEEIDDVSVTTDVIDPPLSIVVGPVRLNVGPVEPVPVLVSRPEVRKGGTVFVPKVDVPVIPLVAAVELGNGGRLVLEGEPTVDSTGIPDVELPTLIVAEPGVVVIASVEKLNPLVRLPLALTELRLSEDPGNVIENSPEPRLLENPVGPTVATVELVMGNGVTVLVVRYDPVPDTVSLELLSGKGVVDGVLEKTVPVENAVTLLVIASEELEALSKDPVMVEGDPVPMILLVSLTPSEVELLKGYETVCELFGEVPMEVVICPDGFPLTDSLAEPDNTLGLVGALVPVIEPPAGPAVGTEEFVMGNGVASLPVRELTAPVFVGDVMVNDSEAGIVKELGTLKEVFVALADGSDEFVIGKGVTSVAPEDVPVGPIVEVIPLPVRPGPDVTKVPVGPAEPFVGVTTGTEEFVNRNGADSLAVTEFVNGKGIIPVLREPVMFAEADVGIDIDPVLELGGPVTFD
ncbi:hypothetical protein F5B21DRAFT_512021 [Xylaria acuta]|nr:hypothetical protein F5B21DRAFT_512021 [Xylaria acuta]